MAWIRMIGGPATKPLMFPPSDNWIGNGDGTITINNSYLGAQYIPVNGSTRFTFNGVANATKTLAVKIEVGNAIRLAVYVNGTQVHFNNYTSGVHEIPVNVQQGDTFALEFQNGWGASVNYLQKVLSIL